MSEKLTAQKKYISDMVVFLTAGHGGMVAGEYTTPLKDWKRHEFSDGAIIYEGEFNRILKSLVLHFLHEYGIKYIDIDPEHDFVSRGVRIDRINACHEKYQNAIHLDLHANAFSGDTATGCEVWLSNNPSSKSLEMAKCLESSYKEMMSKPNLTLPKLPFRGIKNKDFDMVFKTTTPSVIIECPFMTTERECKAWLISLEGRIKLAQWVSNAVLNYINNN